MQGWIVAHPYLTVLAILGLIGAVVMALRSLFADEPADWERYTKHGRLD